MNLYKKIFIVAGFAALVFFVISFFPSNHKPFVSVLSYEEVVDVADHPYGFFYQKADVRKVANLLQQALIKPEAASVQYDFGKIKLSKPVEIVYNTAARAMYFKASASDYDNIKNNILMKIKDE